MYWEEYLNRIKEKYPKPVFRDMFREGRSVIEKIIRIFHNATYMTFTSCDNPETLFKEKTLFKEITLLEFEKIFWDDLDDKINYWLF